MPLERAAGTSGLSLERADLFGVGGVLYYLLTGKPPFDGQTATEIWQKAQAAAWDQTLLDRPEIPAALRQICRRCLATDPADRYGSADALAANLEHFARVSRVARRAVLAATLSVALPVWLWPTAPRAPRAPEPAPDPKLRLILWAE